MNTRLASAVTILGLGLGLGLGASLASFGCKKTDSNGEPPAASAAATTPTTKGVRAALRGPHGAGDGFAPSTKGFKFQNYGNEDGVENLTAEEVKRMFGPSVCADVEAGKCILTPAGEAWMNETNKAMDGGHCEGLATVSLLFQLGKLAAKDFGATTPYELELADNKKLQHEIAYWFSTQFIPPMSTAELNTLTPTEVVDKLVEAFKSGTESFTMGIYQPDGSLGHAITPYAVVDKSERETWVMLYDNNFPGEERHVAIDRTANTWKYFTSSDPKEPGAVYEGDADTHSLTLGPTSVRTGKLVCPFCGDIDPAQPGSGRGTRQIIMDGNADVLVTDDAGKRIGHAGGKLVNEIAGAKIVEVKSMRLGSAHEPIYDLPGGRKLTVTLDGTVLAGRESTDLSMIAPGYTMGVYGVALSPGEKDELTFSADWKEVTYKTEQDETPDLEIGIEEPGADYLFEIRAAGESGGQRLDMSLDVKAGTLAVSAVARDGASTYEVIIHRIGDGGEQVFEHKGIAAGAKDRLVFRYADWKGNRKPMHVGIDRGDDGTIDEDEELGDED